MFAYCGNNPIVREDVSGEFFNTVCGALVGGVISVITCKEKESAGDAFLRGMTTGAIAGAGLDICIATGGIGGLAIAGALGAASAVLDTAWEAKNNGTSARTGELIVSGTVGAGLNVLFGAAGRELTNTMGKGIKEVGKAIVSNTVKGVTSKSGKFALKKALITTAENLASSTIQGSFGKIFSLAGNRMVGVS